MSRSLEEKDSVHSNSLNWLIALLFCFAAAVIVLIWVEVVNPFPDRDSLHQLFFPYLNSLVLARELSWDPFFLKSAFLYTYPWGITFIPACLGAVGCAGFAFLSPWHLPIIFLFPLCAVPAFEDWKLSDKFLLFLVLFFCPVVQIAVKSYSLHGLISLLAIAGSLLVIQGLEKDSKRCFWAGAALIWYSATLKHLGAIQLGNLLLAFLAWKHLRSELSLKHLAMAALFCLSLVPFYPLEGLKDYLVVAFSHNPKLSLMWFTLAVITLGVGTWVLVAWMSKRRDEREVPNLFQNGRGVLFVLCATALIVSFGADEYGMKLMVLSYLLGYTALLYLVYNYDLRSPRGCLYVAIYITLIHGAILYFSFLGQIFANFFLPVALIFALAFYESRARFRVGLALFAIFSSNFMPGLEKAEQWFWEWGHHFYTRGLNGLHQNPLGWESSSLSTMRRDLTKKLETLSFPNHPRVFPMLFRGLHFHTRLQFLYPLNSWLSIPELKLPEHLRHDRLEKMARMLESERGIQQLAENGEFPIFLDSKKPWTSYPVYVDQCEGFQQEVIDRIDGWEDRLNDCLVQIFETAGAFGKHYQLVSLSGGEQRLEVYLHQSLYGSPKTARVPGFDEFLEQKKWYEGLSLWEKFNFQKVEPSERSFELFRRANDQMEIKNWLGAWNLLKQGLEIEPDHAEMLQDLGIVEEELGVKSEEHP